MKGGDAVDVFAALVRGEVRPEDVFEEIKQMDWSARMDGEKSKSGYEQKTQPEDVAELSVASEQAALPWEAPPGQPQAVASTLPGKETLIHMNDTMDATELKDKPAKIRHVIVHAATVTDDDGIEMPVRRTVLVDVKGVAYACVSDGVISSLQQLAAVFGPPPWEDGLLLRMIEKQTRKGYRVYRLIPA